MICERAQREPWERLLCGCQLVAACVCSRALMVSGSNKKNDDADFCGSHNSLINGGSGSSSTVAADDSSVAINITGGSSSSGSGFTSLSLVDDGSGVGCCQRPVKVGEQWLLCGKKKSRFPFHCMVGPDWPMVVLVYTLIICANTVVLGLASSCLGWPVLLIGLSGCLVLLTAYTTVACTDPGIIYKSLAQHQEELEHERRQVDALAAATAAAAAEAAVTAAGSGATEAGAQVAPEQGGDEEEGTTSPINSTTTNNNNIISVSPSSSPSGSTSDVTQPILKKPTTLSGGAAAGAQSSSSSSTSASLSGKQRLELASASSAGVGAVKNTIECGQCNIQRPYSARHCVYCGVCVEELDHHCPWCGKCIGESNMAAFSAFVGMLCFQGYLLAGISIYWIVTCYITSGPRGPGFSAGQ